MSLTSHIEELSGKHRNLEELVDRELSRPAVDTLKVADLKRRKLRIKEKITKLQSASNTASE